MYFAPAVLCCIVVSRELKGAYNEVIGEASSVGINEGKDCLLCPQELTRKKKEQVG